MPPYWRSEGIAVHESAPNIVFEPSLEGSPPTRSNAKFRALQGPRLAQETSCGGQGFVINSAAYADELQLEERGLLLLYL